MGDNTDLLILRDASNLVLRKCAQVLRNLSAFAWQYKDLPGGEHVGVRLPGVGLAGDGHALGEAHLLRHQMLQLLDLLLVSGRG